jgi:ADP-heptose:LPS heptosyltransferase
MQKPNHILVFRFSAMGDVAMTIPVLRALLEQNPQLKITVVTRPFFAPLFKGIPNLEVFRADLKAKYNGVYGLYKLSRDLKALKYTAVADLHNVLRTQVIKLFLMGKPFVQINKGRSEKKALITGKFFKQLKTTHQRYADVFRTLGYKVDLSQPKFPPVTPLNNTLQKMFFSKEAKAVGIAPFAAHKGKMYPFSKMKKVIEILSKQYNVVLFGGGSEEVEVLKSLESSFVNVRSAAGKLRLEDELQLISNLDLMVSMDSGNAHLAAMLGIPVLSLWGVTHPFTGFAPFYQPESNALLPDRSLYPLIPTSVYGNKYPKSYEDAAGSIPPSTIIDKIDKLLSAN